MQLRKETKIQDSMQTPTRMCFFSTTVGAVDWSFSCFEMMVDNDGHVLCAKRERTPGDLPHALCLFSLNFMTEPEH